MSQSAAATPAEAPVPEHEAAGVGRMLPLALLLIPLALFTAVAIGKLMPGEPREPLLPVLSELPDFDLVEINGRPVTKENLKGRIWIADFVFTRCAGPCPMMTHKMSELQKTIRRKTADIRLVTFTLDPEFDTPEVLRKYGEGYGARPEHWLWVRGEKDVLYELAAKGFRLAAEEDVEGDIIHSTRFVLVDGLGRIRGYYNGLESDDVVKLRKDLDLLLEEAAW